MHPSSPCASAKPLASGPLSLLCRASKMCMQVKPPVYDEYTVFGLPSRPADMPKQTIAECFYHVHEMERPGPPRPATPRSGIAKLQEDIKELEQILLGGYKNCERRPLSARPKPQLRFPTASPRGETPQTARPRSALSPRRPLTAIGAYRRVGLDPNAWPLEPSATEAIEKWRDAPKYEEAMLLGTLKAAQVMGKIGPKPLWKMSQFDRVPPRVG